MTGMFNNLPGPINPPERWSKVVKEIPLVNLYAPVPREQWPEHANRLAGFATVQDRGLGSTCKRITDSRDDPKALVAVGKFILAEYGFSLALMADIAKW